MRREKKEYEAHFVHRECSHFGCRNVVTHFAAPKGSDPQTVLVYCREHEYEARR